MSIRSSSKKEPAKNSNRSAYLERFVKDVHRLVVAGYHRINPQGQRDTDERVITQRLVQEINAVIAEEGAPRWMEALPRYARQANGRAGKGGPESPSSGHRADPV